jgi:tetratricopeptide (TPR) repeat protein
MINSHCQQDTAAQQNQSSLQTLSRALSMSQGQFSLILVRCNYSAMREETVRQLREESGIEILEIVLPPSVKTLYTTIETKLSCSHPAALMVFGLESVSAIDRLLTSTNYVREEFRNNFPFPVVLWVTDKILKKLIRLVTDIETWTTTVEFVLGPDELVDFLGKSADRIFSNILESGNWRLSNSAILGANSLSELESATQDLQTCNIRLEPALEASLQFIRGRYEYACHRIPAALELYQESINFWKYKVAFMGAKAEVSDLSFTVHPAPVLEGIVLFHIGLCYRFQAEKYRRANRPYWTEAKNYFQECIDVLERAGRSDAVGIFINQLGEVLQHLEDWEALWNYCRGLAVPKQQVEGELEPYRFACLDPEHQGQRTGFRAAQMCQHRFPGLFSLLRGHEVKYVASDRFLPRIPGYSLEGAIYTQQNAVEIVSEHEVRSAFEERSELVVLIENFAFASATHLETRPAAPRRRLRHAAS